MDMETSEIVTRLVDSVSSQLGLKIQRITLFGSRARGDFKSDSDVDILFLLNPYSKDAKDTIYDISYDLSLDYDTMIAPVVKSSDEYQALRNMGLLFTRNIEAEGIELWKVVEGAFV